MPPRYGEMRHITEATNLKIRVPDTYQIPAYWPFRAF